MPASYPHPTSGPAAGYPPVPAGSTVIGSTVLGPRVIDATAWPVTDEAVTDEATTDQAVTDQADVAGAHSDGAGTAGAGSGGAGSGGPAGGPAGAPPRRAWYVRLVRGGAGDPVWARPALLVLLAATALLYLWGLGASGWANAFYSAAVQAGTVSWKAFFFGSFDSSNFITVDKTPAALWVMELTARVFGVNAWSILVPEALEGVAAVGVLYATVRRWFGAGAGLVAGAVMALTPVAALMFRFNNPDALLVLLMVLAAYATVRALETGSTKWLVLAGVFVGFGFLAKMLQAFLVLPALALVYLLAAPTRPLRRLGQLLLAAVAMLASAGWWVAIVMLTPAADRPYIGGSQHNSILELTFGYNGFGRLNGDETGSVVGGATTTARAGGFWGQSGLFRLFGTDMGGQVSWLIPAALVMLGAGLWLTRRARRTDRARAAYLLWGLTLLTNGLVFSFMQGIIHPYYTVALAPSIGALVGMGGAALYARRRHPAAAATLAASVLVTAWWAFVLLGRSAGWQSWLRPAILVVAVLAAGGLIASFRAPRRLAVVAAGAGLAVALAGPAAYAVQTAGTPHTGSIPSAGPTVAGTSGPGGGGRFGGGRLNGGQFNGGQFNGGRFNGGRFNGQAPTNGAGTVPGGGFPGGGFPGGGFPGGTGNGGTSTGGLPGFTGGTRTGANGGMGGLLQAGTPSAAMVAALRHNAGDYTWVAAAVGSNNAAGYQLASGEPVMSIGGFNGSDPAPTLAQFEKYVSEGKIHYFIGGGGMASMGGSGDSSEIASWVQSHFTATTIGGVSVYDLTAGK